MYRIPFQWCVVSFRCRFVLPFLTCCLLAPAGHAQTNWTLVAWNNLGMHCMDSDYSVFSILPPYNVVNAQLISVVGDNPPQLVASAASLSVLYEAVADPDGSINRTSVNKSNFWDHEDALFGVSLAADEGLPVPGPETYSMPGAANVPQSMRFEAGFPWFAAYGVPITPYDDNGKPNAYSLMRLTARDASSTLLASVDVVLPVSDEMDCKLCHASGAEAAARPASGWVREPAPGRDYRLNVLRKHDEGQAAHPDYAAALAAGGYAAAGLYATVTEQGTPVLCAKCHASEALPGSGYGSIKPLTRAVHGRHAGVTDPRNGMTLDSADNRSACYSCHPGSETRCLRGAMGKAVADDGSVAMQCQSCHGSMSNVGASDRTGWLDEPNCQACHTGTATANNGSIRYTDAFESPGVLRVAVDDTFATNADTPGTGLSLYRFSSGHGGLQCSACHGSTHAEFPSAYRNDNIAAMQIQGHVGPLAECDACHVVMPESASGGPHGLHSLGNQWARNHSGAVENSGVAACRACHGSSDAGTVLSRARGDRTVTTTFGSRSYFGGIQIGCYNCHNGANSEAPTTKGFPTATNSAASTSAGVPVVFTLTASTTSIRVVAQPDNGAVGISGTQATYVPALGFAGVDTFTFAASNGFNDSNLATGTVTVASVDSVGDGVPDWWRQAHFGGDGTLTNQDSCATCDPDADGMPNAEEKEAGTDPWNPRSVVRAFGPDYGQGVPVVGVVSKLGQRFQLYRTTDLPGDSWDPVGDPVWGRTDQTSIRDNDAGALSAVFYRAAELP